MCKRFEWETPIRVQPRQRWDKGVGGINLEVPVKEVNPWMWLYWHIDTTPQAVAL